MRKRGLIVLNLNSSNNLRNRTERAQRKSAFLLGGFDAIFLKVRVHVRSSCDRFRFSSKV